MARLRPLRGVRYNGGHCQLAGVLAPPYDVISPALQQTLYGRDMRNIVRIDFGKELEGDAPGVEDRYTRARGHLDSWLNLGILVRDEQPALYVTDHEFVSGDGTRHVRRGIHGRVPALPWDEGEVLPHERTMRGPKEDRLALMRATGMQTSPVWVLWDRAPGITEALAAATDRPPDVEGFMDGELDREEHRLWVVSDPAHLAAIDAALAPAQLYIADGHHRYETAVAYAQERRAAMPDAPADADFAQILLYACGADDPSVEVWPTHRMVRWPAGNHGSESGGGLTSVTAAGLGNPGDARGASDGDTGGSALARGDAGAATTGASGIAVMPGAAAFTLAALRERLAPHGFTLEPAADLAAATHAAQTRRGAQHAFGVAASDGAALLTAPRRTTASPRESLDVSVLADRILGDGLGITAEAIAGGALSFTRDVDEAERAVRSGTVALAFTCNSTTTAEIVAVSDAGEVMPQKSTYFYPKVPTGLVLSPL